MHKLTDIVLGIACLAFQGPIVNCFKIKFLNFKLLLRGWRAFAAIKSTCCSGRGPGFISQTHIRLLEPPGLSYLLSRSRGAQVQRALVLPSNDPTEPSAAVIHCFGHPYQMLLASPLSPETAGPLKGQDSELQEVNIIDSGYFFVDNQYLR